MGYVESAKENLDWLNSNSDIGVSLADISSMTDFVNKANDFDYGKKMLDGFNPDKMKIGNYLKIAS